jgi:dihydroorotase
VWQPLVAQYPDLKVVMEHITTEDGVNFVLSAGPNVAATLTPQHLLYNRNGALPMTLRDPTDVD